MKPFTVNVLTVLQEIPNGRVMTYGQVAKVAGSRQGARQVVRILHSMSKKYELPWHRVVTIKGQIALKGEEGVFTQKRLLSDEGIEVNEENQVDLERYQYHPNINLEEK